MQRHNEQSEKQLKKGSAFVVLNLEQIARGRGAAEHSVHLSNIHNMHILGSFHIKLSFI